MTILLDKGELPFMPLWSCKMPEKDNNINLYIEICSVQKARLPNARMLNIWLNIKNNWSMKK